MPRKMFQHWFIGLCFLLVVSYVLSQDIPEVVNRFDDARTLWNTLHTNQFLLGSLDTRTFSRDHDVHWQSYLQAYGDDIIATEPRGGGLKSQGTFNKISSMKRFVKAPGALGPFTTHDRLSESIARRLIEGYARHKDANGLAATSVIQHGPPLIDFLGVSDRGSR